MVLNPEITANKPIVAILRIQLMVIGNSVVTVKDRPAQGFLPLKTENPALTGLATW
jgi:hypothetical protein